MANIRVLELFAGIGACSKALERIGIEHEIVDAVEIDKYAIASFNAIHGTNFEPQDITTWDKDIECDLIMHGSPCQDFSVAGKGAGGDEGSGTRSSLMYETLRIVEKLKPEYVIWENVKNLLSAKHRHNFDAYLERMTELGYINYYQVLNAKDYGVPQNRERVFTVSMIKPGSVPWAVVPYVTLFKFPARRPLTKRLKDVLEIEVDEKYYLKKTNNIVFSEKRVHWDNSGKGYGSQQDRAVYEDGLAPTLSRCNCHGDKAQVYLENQRRIRKLTPKECWRLMGFDDADFEKAEKVNSNTQLYKQAGNSIVVNVLEAILTSLLKGENETTK